MSGNCISCVSRTLWLFVFSDEKKPCPLCPEEKFKACYSHKLHRHLQNLHWKVSVAFEGNGNHLNSEYNKKLWTCRTLFCVSSF